MYVDPMLYAAEEFANAVIIQAATDYRNAMKDLWLCPRNAKAKYMLQNGRLVMAILFSKVTLTAENGNAAQLLCSGIPKSHYDLEDWLIYQKFICDKPDSTLKPSTFRLPVCLKMKSTMTSTK